jgi:nitrogen-specific signal transduction histidine kinase/CheY-like chemotaxis protein
VGKNLFSDPAVEGGVITARDITERRKTQELQQQLRDRLAQSEKLAALGELLAGVAHELNNPLSVVIGHSELLMEWPDPKVAARASKIQAAAERCGRLVKNFLAVARQHPQERALVDVNELVRQVTELLAYPLRVDSVELILELACDLPSISADPHQLHQVVVNLVTNAHHAVREVAGSRRITISTGFDRDRGRVRIDITDSGPGIAPEVEARIFEPFFTTKAPGQGTGLGLPICKGIVEAHHGALEVDGRPGRGARVRVALPLGQAPPEPTEPPAHTPIEAQGASVLVVDDEIEVAGVLAETLARAGYRVHTATNGLDALSKLAEAAPDVILSDIKMPRLDGRGLYRALEEKAPHLLSRFVFITGDILSPSTAKFLEEAARPCLNKPFTLQEVEAVLDRVLSR